MQRIYIFDLYQLIGLTRTPVLEEIKRWGGDERSLRPWYEWCACHSLTEVFSITIENHRGETPALANLYREMETRFSQQIYECMYLNDIQRIPSDVSYVAMFNGRHLYLTTTERI